MTWQQTVKRIIEITNSFINMADYHYHMIIDNPLILAFVLLFAIFVGLTLLKRMIHIN